MNRPSLELGAYPATIFRELFLGEDEQVLYGDTPENWAMLNELEAEWTETVRGFVRLVSTSIDEGVLRVYFEVDHIVLSALPVQPRMGDRVAIELSQAVQMVYEVQFTHGEMLAGVDIDLDLGELLLIPAGSMIHVSDLDELD